MRPKKYGESGEAPRNRILASLPKSSRNWLDTLQPVALPRGAVLYEPDEAVHHAYFLNNALVSILSTNSEGGTVEIGLIGSEGLVGVTAVLGGVTPYRAVVQMSGDAFRIRGEKLNEEFQRNMLLRELLLRYTNAFIVQIAQSSICNCYHTLQERFCRWLLIARDAVGSDVLVFTHDVIARLLATRRASVTVAAGILQRAGLIKINRGQLIIVDPAGIELLSCECYGIVRDGLRRLQPS